MALRIGTRSSNLAVRQAEDALRRLREACPAVACELVSRSSPGDRDRGTDLRESPADFFTRDLDEAVRNGELDGALHSAKDVPDPIADGLDWCWLPWREDPRDVLVLAPGRTVADLPPAPRAGVSSDRRAEYVRARFPNATPAPLRGNIEERLRRLDEGAFDLAVMAGAALRRLGLADRITEWIGLEDLPTPDGQGTLALSFRAGDTRFRRLRSLFARNVVFAGAGAGDAGLCTRAAAAALARAEVCLYDALLDDALLDLLPPRARRVDVGKRSGAHRREQDDINVLLTRYARRGARVVRLKGGDPGIFGRLAEEVEALDALALPYRVLPGVSSLNVATTGSGMLLTRRGVARGFCVLSAREGGGRVARVTAKARAELPCVFFMGTAVAGELAAQLIGDGRPPDTPAAIVYGAGTPGETVLRGTLAELGALGARASESARAAPGLLLVGELTRFAYDRSHGALAGRRVLLTCSETLLERAVALTWDLGGQPVPRPLIRLERASDAAAVVRDVAAFDWVVVTSPTAVRALVSALVDAGSDLRDVPKVLVAGAATAAELRRHGLQPAAVPERDAGADGVAEQARARFRPGERVLRLRSDRAGTALAAALARTGAKVEDRVLYRNRPVAPGPCPAFDAVLFASASAVDAFVDAWGAGAADARTLVALGPPTAAALARHGLAPGIVPPDATVESALHALAGAITCDQLRKLAAAAAAADAKENLP